MSIKLNAQSGGSVALDAPTQTTSSADVTFKLPVADGSANQVIKTDGSGNLSFGAAGNSNALQVLEEFFVPCDGTAVTTAQGSVAITNVTAAQDVGSSLATCTGSEISYQPPANTKIVIYTYQFAYNYNDANTITGFQIQLDGTKVGKRPISKRTQTSTYDLQTIIHPFRIEPSLSADTGVGRVQSWNSAKTIRIQMRYWSSSFEGTIHEFGEAFRESDGSFENNQFCMPCVGIKAIGAV